MKKHENYGNFSYRKLGSAHAYWWKILCIILLLYTFGMGFFYEVPMLPILRQSIRNLYFHVAMWMVMMLCFAISLVYATRYLNSQRLCYDSLSLIYARMGIICGLLGLITGSLWAKSTWGAYWSNDPKQLGAAIGLLIYCAYMLLRHSIMEKKNIARLSAVYNIFAFAMLFPTMWILPRMVDSLHPGGMGNPALNTNDIDWNMRIIFYPAILGWSLLVIWIATLEYRIKKINLEALKK